MDAQLSAKLQKKLMEQSPVMVMNVDNGQKFKLFWDPFAQIKANTIFFKKSELADFNLYGCPTSCKVIEKSNGTVLRNGHEC